MRALSDQASLDPYASPYALCPPGMDLTGASPRHLAKKLRPDSGDSFGTPTSASAGLPPFPVISAHGAWAPQRILNQTISFDAILRILLHLLHLDA